jgi:hypothetical protein
LASPTGSVVVAGSGASVTVPFVPTFESTYAVVVAASGLDVGATWSATVAGFTQTSTVASITFYETNGTYSYRVSAVNYGTATPSGQVTVNGAPGLVSVTFVLVTYAVTFTETGLLLGASWAVTVDGTAWSGTGASISNVLQNGTYSYTIASVGAYEPTPSSGTFTVAGAAVTTPITFATLTLTFTEAVAVTGSWTVTLNGVPVSATGASLSFAVVNGSYTYFVAPPTGYTASPSAGLITVNGHSVTTSITMTSTSGTLSVTLQTGGPSTAQLWVGPTYEGNLTAGTPLTLTLTVGTTYPIVIVAGGYFTYYNNATILASGTSVAATLNSNSNGGSSSGISSLGWGLIILFVVLTVIFLITTVYYMRRAKPPATPPPSWSSGSSGTQGGTTPPPSK